MYKIISPLIFCLCLFSACEQAPNLPKVDHIEVDSKILRFDKALLSLDTTNVRKSYRDLQLKFPALTDLFFDRIIPVKNDSSVDFDEVRKFITNPFVRRTLDTIAIIHPNLKAQEKELSESLKYYKHYFPDATIPKLYAGYSDFSFQTFIFDDYQNDGICASLDLYLGADYPYKNIEPKNPAFSEYLTRRYDKEFLTKKVMELLVEEQIGALRGKRTVDHMIYQGKKWYLLFRLMPSAAPEVISEFTKEQWDWCEDSEKSIWSYFLDNKLIYETNQTKIKTYVFESPKSQGMPAQAPGRTAHYLGWKIIESYMSETNIEISDLIKETDSQKILKLSKYKPKRK